MVDLLGIVSAGLVGTSCMMAAMWWATKRNWVEADMVRAIGSLFTRSEENAFWPGLVIHYSAGIFFASVYSILLRVAPVVTAESAVALTTAFGLVHGIVVALLLIIAVAEHHPIERFQKPGAGVAIAHILGHVIYGFFVGVTLVWLGNANLILVNGISFSFQDSVGFSATWILLFGLPVFAPVVLALWFLYQVGEDRKIKERH